MTTAPLTLPQVDSLFASLLEDFTSTIVVAEQALLERRREVRMTKTALSEASKEAMAINAELRSD